MVEGDWQHEKSCAQSNETKGETSPHIRNLELTKKLKIKKKEEDLLTVS